MNIGSRVRVIADISMPGFIGLEGVVIGFDAHHYIMIRIEEGKTHNRRYNRIHLEEISNLPQGTQRCKCGAITSNGNICCDCKNGTKQ